MATYGYIRVSTVKQDLAAQRFEILNYAQLHRIQIDDWVEVELTTKASMAQRRVEELMDKLREGDTVVVAELSRLGRSLSELVFVVDAFIQGKITMHCLKQNWVLEGGSLKDRMYQALWGLLAEFERNLISERTKQALSAKKAAGVTLGRPRGAKNLNGVKLDQKRAEILAMLRDRAPKSYIARKLSVSRSTLCDYIKTRNLQV